MNFEWILCLFCFHWPVLTWFLSVEWQSLRSCCRLTGWLARSRSSDAFMSSGNLKCSTFCFLSVESFTKSQSISFSLARKRRVFSSPFSFTGIKSVTKKTHTLINGYIRTASNTAPKMRSRRENVIISVFYPVAATHSFLCFDSAIKYLMEKIFYTEAGWCMAGDEERLPLTPP